MKQYLLSMYQPQGDPPPPEILQPIMQKLGVIRQELVDAAHGCSVMGSAPRTRLPCCDRREGRCS